MSSLVTTVVLINACHNCAVQGKVQIIRFQCFARYLESNHLFICSQKTKLITNIEKLTFWNRDHKKLHFAKKELMLQITQLDISINGNDFFIIDRKLLASVSHGIERKSIFYE